MLANFFRVNELDFEGFVVGDTSKNPSEAAGKKVIGIVDYERIKEESILIIALGSTHWEEVSHTLREHGISEYIYPILVNPYTSYEEIKNYG